MCRTLPSPSVPSIVLFDLDGTLVHLTPPRPDLETLRSAMRELCSEAGIDPVHLGIFAMYGDLQAAAGPAGADALLRASALLRDYEDKWAAGAEAAVTPGSLIDLRDAGHLLGLVTNNGIGCVDALIVKRQLDAAFAAMVTRDDGLRLKPDPAPVARAVDQLRRQRASGPIYYVGDSDADAEAVAAYNEQAAEGESIEMLVVGHDGGERPTTMELLRRFESNGRLSDG